MACKVIIHHHILHNTIPHSYIIYRENIHERERERERERDRYIYIYRDIEREEREKGEITRKR